MAAWKYGLAPQTLAAFIGAEASPDGRGEWNPKSASSTSSARGLTQFKTGTWEGEGERRGSYLNGVAHGLGYLDKKGKISAAHEKDFLNLRFDTKHSINAAADYASYNLTRMRRRELIRNESPAALARYAYIAHHEGLQGATEFLRGGRLDESHWNQNVPLRDRASLLAANGQDLNTAYRAFVHQYTDDRVDVTHYMYDPGDVVPPPTGQLTGAGRNEAAGSPGSVVVMSAFIQCVVTTASTALTR